MAQKNSTCKHGYYYLSAVVVDFLIISTSIVLSVFCRFGVLSRFPVSTYIGTWSFFAFCTFILSIGEHLYELRSTVNRTMHVFRMIRLVLVSTALYVILFFLLHFPSGVFLDSRIAVVLFMMIWIVLWVPARIIILPRLFAMFCHSRSLRLKIALIGPGSQIRRISSILMNSPVYKKTLTIELCDIELPDDSGEVFDICMANMERTGAKEFAVVFSDHDFSTIAEFSQKSFHAGASFYIYSPKILRLRYFDPWLSLTDSGVITFFGGRRIRGRDILVRITDILSSCVLLVLLFPLLLSVVIAIKLSSKGPVLFKQKRVGHNLNRFTFYKYRSMYTDESANTSAHQEYFRKYANGSAASSDGKIFKLDQSSKITPIGRLIRKTSIDELPQLLNVLRGNMTLVGPRPCIEYELEHYKGWQMERFAVKPGLTGIWQVYGRSRLPFDTAQFLDFLYTMDTSYSLNLRLILKTIPVMLFSKGGI